jgi:hypothetical protein
MISWADPGRVWGMIDQDAAVAYFAKGQAETVDEFASSFAARAINLLVERGPTEVACIGILARP